jgi:hypothetical protein
MQTEARSLVLSGDQFLLVTLIVNLAVAAILATMLARFKIFRAILLTERRDWPQRLIFAAGFGTPLVAGVAARILLNYDAADLTLAGSYLTDSSPGPMQGRSWVWASGCRRSRPANMAPRFRRRLRVCGAACVKSARNLEVPRSSSRSGIRSGVSFGS